PKKQYIPNWYQSQAETIEKKVEEIEGSVRSLAEGQQAIVNQINDLFSQLKVCIEEVSKRRNDGENSNGRGRGPKYGPNANYTAKPLKLDFPKVQRKRRSNELEDDAQLWFQVLIQETPDATWEEFKTGIYATYGPHQFLDYFGELTKLRQQGMVQSYQTQFNKLLAKVGYLPPDRQVSCFVSGLSDTIRTEVQANFPTNLSTAISLA
ncbi:organic solute transporter OST-alpha, partial [Tanacetum coccineum]